LRHCRLPTAPAALRGGRSFSAKQPQVREVAPAAVQVKSVADEELVRHGEADVADRKALDQAPVRAVEEGHRRERARLPQRERLDEEVERHPGVDDVLDEEDVPPLDAQLQVLQEPYPSAAAAAVALVARQGDEIEVVGDRQCAGEVRKEDGGRLQRGDEDRLAAGIVSRDGVSKLGDPSPDVVGREIDLADACVQFGR
jgi:hypothetical protein